MTLNLLLMQVVADKESLVIFRRARTDLKEKEEYQRKKNDHVKEIHTLLFIGYRIRL